jgi:hypothetical protein
MAAAAHLEPYIGVAPPTFPCPPAAKFGAACGMGHVPGRSVRVGSYLTSKRDSATPGAPTLRVPLLPQRDSWLGIFLQIDKRLLLLLFSYERRQGVDSQFWTRIVCYM